MSIITVEIPKVVLDTALTLLERIAVAVERIAGPVIEYRPPRQSTLSDLHINDPGSIMRARQAKAEEALKYEAVPGSEKADAVIRYIEEVTLAELGQDAVDELPWRREVKRAPTG
jgi:hypothetical protein